jgi:hypothetical protein
MNSASEGTQHGREIAVGEEFVADEGGIGRHVPFLYPEETSVYKSRAKFVYLLFAGVFLFIAG